jgi:DNA primase
MAQSGMLVAGEEIAVPYDRFRNRVMFPITDMKGRVIAFGGRALDADAPAKYLNSPETPLFHKGSVLFNAHGARQAAFDTGRIVAVEGYMDAIAMVEAGIAETVAPLGTALTESQLQLLWRMAREPILCFDGDGAGRKAAFRALDTALPHLRPGASVTFAFLPDGLDPDDLIRQDGPEALRGVLERARPLADILWEREWNSGQWSTPERRAQLERRLFGLIASIGDGSVRSHYEQDMRARLAKAWGHASAQRFQGRPGRNAPAAGRQRWQGRSAGPGAMSARRLPPEPIASTSSLRSSALVADDQSSPPYREALLLKVLLNHSWLIEEDAEAIAALPFTHRGFTRVRDAMLSLHAEQNCLDSTGLRTHLTVLGLAQILALVERAITHRGDKFAEPEADRAAVEAGWRHAVALHNTQVGVRRALMAAERAWHAEGSEEALARIRELQGLLGRGDGFETTIESSSQGTGGHRLE